MKRYTYIYNRYIAYFLLTLLLLGGTVNEAWAVVTYHILTKPFTTYKNDGTANYSNIRVEALRCTSNDLTVGLPEDYKSPLATGFTYYAATDVTKSPSRVKIYANNNTSFDTYTIADSPSALSEGTVIDDGSDIYVIYEYNASNGIADLTGATEYNIEIGDRFLAFNGDRGNRPGSIAKTSVTAAQLAGDEFSYITNGVNNNHNFYFKWKFLGSDPYNIKVETAYSGSGTYNEGNQRKKTYTGSSMYAQLTSGGSTSKIWLSNETDTQWSNGDGISTSKPGYYRSMNPVFNSFVLLNHKTDNYTLVGSVVNTNGNNWQPNASGQYMHLMNNGGTNPEILPNDATAADQIKLWPIETYTYKVHTPLSGTDISATTKLSSYTRVNEPSTILLTSAVPESLKRKYCSFTYFYKEAAKTNQITTYAEAYENGKVIYVDYNVSGLPFETSTSYATAKWYNIKKYSASAFLGFETSDNKVYSNGSHTETDTKNQFAFIGDPYELRVINRYESVTNSANYYAGFSSDATDAQMTVAASPTVYTWEIEDESRTTDFLLRSFNRGSPLYWNWEGSGTTVASYKTEGSKVVVSELPQYTYKYHIIRSDGTEAIYASTTQDATIQLSLATLPGIIVSPYLIGETLTFYSDAACTSAIHEAPATTNADIYVKYTTTAVSSKTVKLNNTDEFNVKLNGEYIYWDTSDGGVLKTTATLTDAQAANNYYLWRLEGGDPYAMKIYNKGLNQYVKATFSDNQALSFNTEANASLFIAKLSGSVIGEYEVMAATGSGTDASTTYYNIGRSATDVVKIYSNSSYAHGSAQLKFILEQTRTITYHLFDISKTELLSVTSKSPDLALPSEYVSPLVATYHYYTSKANALAGTSAITTMPSGSGNVDIYVTYDVNDLISFGVGSKMYRLRFANGVNCLQEDGKDGVTGPLKPYYPYANGDCNFFVYGDDQMREQLGGAASTRTRWPWYVESLTSDPYHVKIVSRQQQTNDGVNHRMYFRTYKPEGYDYIVTGLTMPGISENAASEYMVLGQVGAFKLVTTETVTGKLPGDAESSTARRTVTSFEQYWKTYDTIKLKIFSAGAAVLSDPFTVPNDDYTSYNTEHSTNYTYRTYLTDVLGWHCYDEWAYAKRWNGYNAAEAKSKGFEDIEHWYQTVDMGDGSFNFEEMEITPVLVLLDQHGWEIMRKPLPTGPNDPDKEAKYDAIRPYNSPMVKDYYFFNNATKVTGYHRYTLRTNDSGYRDHIKLNGQPYTSTDLTSLPPYGTASGIMDSFGDIQDQYVVYTVKDEYAQNLNQEFLVLQGGQVAYTDDGSTISSETPSGGLSAWVTAGSIDDKYKWTVTRNSTIDTEMGYSGSSITYTTYDKNKAGIAQVPAWPAADGAGFDPYNIQIRSAKEAYNTKYFTTNATSATLSEGSWSGNGSSVSLAASGTAFIATGRGHDNTSPVITNQTFMAVADANGNMQLMPRFDHNHRVQAFTTLDDPQTNSAGDQTGTQTTFMLRPLVYEYIIVDNQGRESLRYKAGGEFYPGIPGHFKSPLATNFKYYREATIDNVKTVNDAGYYSITESTETTPSEYEITGSFAEAGLNSSTNTVYVRYTYDETYDTDHDLLLKGPWLTVSLGGDSKWIYYNGTLNAEGSGIFTAAKPSPITDAYQWKFLRSPYISDPSVYLAPDPYAVTLSNREANANNKNTALQVGTTTRYALLAHPDGGYALAAAGTGNTDAGGYTFLNGSGIGTPQAAAITAEASFSPTSSTISPDAQLQVTNDITHTYTYRVISNGNKLAVSASQTNDEAASNGFDPVVPNDAQSPLLNIGDYTYYGLATESDGTYTINALTQIESLYGIYNDEVFVRYTYNASTSPFRVPNVKGTVDSHVAKGAGSNDSPLDIGGELGYNIIWYNDNMMYNNSGSVGDDGSKSLTGTETRVWQFAGSDPYALQIKNKGATKYLNGTATLADNASTTFMLLKKDGYDYGILQATGTGNRLTNYGEQTTTSDPTKYIIFALATYKLYYTLLVGAQNTNLKTIPVRTVASGEQTNTTITGTSMRTSAPDAYDAGTVSLGDALATPYTLSRPFCSYEYYIDVVQNSDASANTTLTSKYQGLKCDYLPDDAELIGKIMYVDVVYSFNTDEDFTDQKDYVANPTFRFETDNTNSSTTKWYTAESRSAIPFLVNYKYTGTLVGASAGRDQHYTNDHLWCPVGDPYGFYLHNRYCTKNGNGWNEVMTTSSSPDANMQMTMSTTPTYAVYEMYPTTTAGYFRLHPLSGAAGLFVYGSLNGSTPEGRLSLSNSTDWIFNLTSEQVEPYYTRRGYVGGLNSTGVTAYNDASTLREKQNVVYNSSNITGYSSGYYRLHSIPSASISPVRYASGYTHETEKTGGAGDTAIPLHFHEQTGTTNTFYGLGSGFTSTNATRGEIPISAVEYDPASIFYFDSNNRIKTQALEVKENKMTATANDGTQFTVEDIGGAVVTLRNGTLSAGRYLNYNQSSDIYDLKYTTGELQDYTKWCMEPANGSGLLLTLNSGGDNYYYATFYAPYDVTLPSTATAYICNAWDTEIIHPVSIGQTIPAGTPAIIRSTAAGPITLTLPGTASSSTSCVFSGKYLEQLLSTEITASDKIYSFGLSITGLNLTTDSGTDNGRVHGTDVTKATSGVGFYLNANPNKETDPSQALWTKNNRYVYHNKIYYRAPSSPAKPDLTRSIDFIPVRFDDDDAEPISEKEDWMPESGDNRIYDLQGRCVATADEVEDGSWRHRLSPGIYVINGKKFCKK